jgi:DNA-binding SARP family transcriptional activator
LNRLNDHGDVTTLQQVELGVLGPLQVRQYGLPVAIPGAKPRAILTMLGLHGGSVVSADTLLELLWGDDPPRTAAKALQTHISSLRRALGDGFVLTEGTGWTLSTTEIDATRYKSAAKLGREAFASGDVSQAVARFDEARTLWRGTPELPDGARGVSEKTRWIEGHAAVVEERADALLATGRAAEIIGELEAAIADAPLRERRWCQLMLALYRAGRQGEALGAYQRARSLLTDELGVDPGPDLRRLEAAIVAQDDALEIPVSRHFSSVMRAVTFLLTDIEGSTAAWESDADAMAVALARHDEIVEQVVTSRGGRLVKTRGEGDATFSVFDRPSAAAAAAIELQEAIRHEPWTLAAPLRIRVALHTGEVELRDGDYFGRAVNRAARLRSLATGGQILCSGATAELVIDTLADDVALADLGMRQLKNLARPEHVFELRLETADDSTTPTSDEPMERPSLPAVLAGPGPFVGRSSELARLLSAYQLTLNGGTGAVLIAGEPGVGKTRLAGEWSRQAFEQGAVVLYGRCDEDLGAPYQPFAEALRSLVPCLGANRVRGLRGVEALLPLVPGLTDTLPDLAAPPRADPDTERYALFDAVVALLGVASTSAPVVLILDDLHWAAKPTLLLLRHLLRFGEHARVQILGTYRSTDLDRSHPLAAMLADLHRDGSSHRLQLSGLDEDDISAYVAEAGYDDEELARALASVTGGNPFFLIEALRHVDESGGRWDPSTLPQGVREAVSRRLSRLPAETNKALAAAAVVGSRFSVALVESVVGDDLIDAFDEACKAGIVIEEPGGRYRFNHAIVRQSLLAELASVRRMRLHQRIATTLETEPGADEELLAELAYHYFECAWAGNAAKAVEYCRRAADQAMARLAYEGAADLYDKALHALEEIDDEMPDRDDQQAELLVARCEALLAAGDVVTATGAVSQLQAAASDSARLAAWGTCFDGQLSTLTDPERLDEIESALVEAAEKLAGLEDAAGEAKAHTVRAGCLARLGRIGDCETALDQALTAARRAREHRRVNAVLANAPLAALWGPNPVPRAGGRCLDVIRLLRITTGSPVVEATSTRCQGVLDAFRGRAAAGRALIDSARRTLTELGMRHALLEVDQFAGIVELVADDPAAAEPHLRRAYNGFHRLGIDADTAETAALLARVCLALDRDGEADELCTESERLAGHALKPSIAWRTVRAQLLARGGAHGEAREVAEQAVTLAGRTDALVDHGDACLTLAKVLNTAGDTAGARVAASKAVELYELKGAAALAEKARLIIGERGLRSAPAAPEEPVVDLENACVRAGERVVAAIDREAWDEVEQLFAPEAFVESRRKIVGFTQIDLPSANWPHENRRVLETGAVRAKQVVIAMRGERLALVRLVMGTADVSAGAPQDEFLQLYAIDEEGRIALQVFFDIEDLDAAIAELDAAHARLEAQQPRPPLENAASRGIDRYVALFAESRWDEIGMLLAEDVRIDDRRQGLRGESNGRAAAVAEARTIAALGVNRIISKPVALRGDRLCLSYLSVEASDNPVDAFHFDALSLVEMDTDGLFVGRTNFDPEDLDAAIEELDARYVAGEAAPHAHTWSVIAKGYAAFNRRELLATTPEWESVDHRRGAGFAPGEMIAYIQAAWVDSPDTKIYIAAVHRLSDLGGVVTHVAHGISQEGFHAEWRDINVLTVDGEMTSRSELFDEADLDTALATFDGLSRPAPRLENTATKVEERFQAYFAARDWAAMGEILADDISADDRRRVVNAGIRHGRDAKVADMQATADLGTKNGTSTVIAIRGQRLAVLRICLSGRDQRPDAFHTEMLGVVEIDADNRMAARVLFDVDDLDAAFEELDARYLAGEAAPHARVWQSAMDTLGEANCHEPGPILRGLTYVDHRRVSFGSRDFGRAVEELWALVPDARYRVTAVHALDTHGTVASLVIEGTDSRGHELQWSRIVALLPGEPRMEVYEEDDLEAALARFEELRPQVRQLDNAATRFYERFRACLASRDWAAFAELLATEVSTDDRRRVVNAGVRHGRDAVIAEVSALTDIGLQSVTSDTIAIRGERLALSRIRSVGDDQRNDAFFNELLDVLEIDADERVVARVVFDVDDIEAAVEELDARYLAGEAAPYSRTWSVIAGAFEAHNRQELPATKPDVVSIDHRRVAAFAPGEGIEYLRAGRDLFQDAKVYIEKVHRMSDLGAVFTWAGHGSSHEGFAAEWRGVNLMTVDGDMVSGSEVFDESDLDAGLARFEELQPQTPRLENAASQVTERFWSYYAACNWDAVADTLAENITHDDRRRVLNSGLRRGRDAQIANMQAVAVVGTENIIATAFATRGERLVLGRSRFYVRDGRSEEVPTEVVDIVEIDADNQISAHVVFDPEDIDAAFEELDARYLAGEAAAHAHTWSVITRAYAALNRHEIPATTPDWENIDYRRVRAFAPGDQIAYLRATWDVAPDFRMYIEAVHRLSDVGAVVTNTMHGTSHGGFEAEWREIAAMTVEGDLFNRSELFDEADLDAALARFDELTQPAPRLENTASQVCERFRASFAARDWDAMTEMLAEDGYNEDRRRVVNAGIRRGRAAEMENLRAVTDVGVTYLTAVVIATRGDRLVLVRGNAGNDERPDALQWDVLQVAGIDADDRIAAILTFDADDIDSAFAELDARYLAGETAAHAHTWSVITRGLAAFNRREMPGFTPDSVNVDHRLAKGFAPGDLTAYIGATWDLAPDVSAYAEAVHRLSNLGAVWTHAVRGTSQDGFDAEWREICLATVEGDLISRIEMFDEEDIDAALAKFDELGRPAPQLENVASQSAERFCAYFTARDWTSMAGILAQNMSVDDRRRVVGAGVRHGREAEIENLRAWADIGIKDFKSDVIAIRGARLALCHARWSGPNQSSEAFHSEALGVIEINADNQITARVMLDPDDFDAALTELEARYLAGEASAHAQTWSLVTGAYAALNRREVPATTPDWVNIDHRRGRSFAPGDMIPYIRAMWNVTPDLSYYAVAVYKLSDIGAVVSHAGYGTSQQGFDAEWREIVLLTFEGDLVNRCETFDESDLDAALAKFDELDRPNPRLDNAASQAYERFKACFAARGWDVLAEILADDVYSEDRRRVVNAGQQQGRDAVIAELSGLVEVVKTIKSEVIASRGARLVLSRVRAEGYEAFVTDLLDVIEVDSDGRVVTRVALDPDDLDAAFEELDARYLAGEAAPHAHTWSLIARNYAAFNRHEFPSAAPDWATIDHRRGASFKPGDLTAYIRATWDIAPDTSTYIEAAHRVNDRGAVFTQVSKGTSQQGFEAEWREICLLTADGETFSGCELFDETDLDVALARLDELSRPTPRLANVASRVDDRFEQYFAARDWHAMAELMADDISVDDRRRVVNAGVRLGRDVEIASLRAVADLGVREATSAVIATRGERLALSRNHFLGRDRRPEAFRSEMLCIIEIDADERIVARISFDLDDMDAAFAELDARYLAGEAADHAHTWSVIARAFAAFNQHVMPPTTPDWVTIDHRKVTAFAPGDMTSYMRATFDVAPDIKFYAEAVHRLSDLGAVFTQAGRGFSHEGFEAEWRDIILMSLEGDQFNRCEVFDDADLEAALARFDELSAPTTQLDNVATRTWGLLADAFNRRDVDAFVELTSPDGTFEDRRKGLRDSQDASMRRRVTQTLFEFPRSWRMDLEHVAIRGSKLSLSRQTVRDSDEADQPITLEVLMLTECSDDNLACNLVLFDPDDIDCAMAELTARWIASGQELSQKT